MESQSPASFFSATLYSHLLRPPSESGVRVTTVELPKHMNLILRITAVLVICHCGLTAKAASNWTGEFEPCHRSSELSKHDHMEIGVWINISDGVLRTEFRRAMDFWAEVLDMSWYEQDTSECAIQVLFGDPSLFSNDAIAARSQFVDKRHFHGWIAFNPNCRERDVDMYLVAIHEIGHMMGLQHNSDLDSIMFFLNPRDPPLLDATDLTALKKRHKLREAVSAHADTAHRVTPDLLLSWK